VYAFVPAHGDSRVGAVQEHLGRTWSEDFGLAVLLVDFVPESAGEWGDPMIRRDGSLDRCSFCGTDASALRKMIASVESNYDVICVNLTGALEPAGTAILNMAHSVFLVSDSARPSLEMAGATIARLRRFKLEDRIALLLRRTNGGLRPDLAEDLVGAPVCGLVETSEQMGRLARWLAQPQPSYTATLSA
jgi:Flp pilus assembly CpaE family ATPase